MAMASRNSKSDDARRMEQLLVARMRAVERRSWGNLPSLGNNNNNNSQFPIVEAENARRRKKKKKRKNRHSQQSPKPSVASRLGPRVLPEPSVTPKSRVPPGFFEISSSKTKTVAPPGPRIKILPPSRLKSIVVANAYGDEPGCPSELVRQKEPHETHEVIEQDRLASRSTSPSPVTDYHALEKPHGSPYMWKHQKNEEPDIRKAAERDDRLRNDVQKRRRNEMPSTSEQWKDVETAKRHRNKSATTALQINEPSNDRVPDSKEPENARAEQVDKISDGSRQEKTSKQAEKTLSKVEKISSQAMKAEQVELSSKVVEAEQAIQQVEKPSKQVDNVSSGAMEAEQVSSKKQRKEDLGAAVQRMREAYQRAAVAKSSHTIQVLPEKKSQENLKRKNAAAPRGGNDPKHPVSDSAKRLCTREQPQFLKVPPGPTKQQQVSSPPKKDNVGCVQVETKEQPEQDSGNAGAESKLPEPEPKSTNRMLKVQTGHEGQIKDRIQDDKQPRNVVQPIGDDENRTKEQKQVHQKRELNQQTKPRKGKHDNLQSCFPDPVQLKQPSTRDVMARKDLPIREEKQVKQQDIRDEQARSMNGDGDLRKKQQMNDSKLLQPQNLNLRITTAVDKQQRRVVTYEDETTSNQQTRHRVDHDRKMDRLQARRCLARRTLERLERDAVYARKAEDDLARFYSGCIRKLRGNFLERFGLYLKHDEQH